MQKKVVLSDDFLTESGVTAAAEVLGKLKAETAKVVVIGGSHSGFSSVWTCLHHVEGKAAEFRARRLEKMQLEKNKNNTNAIEKDNEVRDSEVRPRTVAAGRRERPGTSNTGAGMDVAKTDTFGLAGIALLHRSHIRVFYESKKEADQDGYKHEGNINKATGQVNFTRTRT